jgi:hypothetical protein
MAGPEHFRAGNQLQLEVSDTGCGMSVETQARAFDPFFTTTLGGHGLGLAMVQGIVRGLDGSIDVRGCLKRVQRPKWLCNQPVATLARVSDAVYGVSQSACGGPQRTQRRMISPS